MMYKYSAYLFTGDFGAHKLLRHATLGIDDIPNMLVECVQVPRKCDEHLREYLAITGQFEFLSQTRWNWNGELQEWSGYIAATPKKPWLGCTSLLIEVVLWKDIS